MIDIDGSIGGGSVVRIGVPLAILTDQKTRITNIRLNRPKPGLSIQHVQGLNALIDLTGTSIKNVHLRSSEIVIEPCLSFNPEINVSIQTAGSIGLVYQIIQNVSLTSPTRIQINVEGGATYGKWAPPLAYIKNVTYRLLHEIGLRYKIEVIKEGFFPKGGAKASLTIFPPQNFSPLELLPIEKESKWEINGEIVVSTHLAGRQVGDRIKRRVEKLCKRNNIVINDLEIKKVNSLNDGCGICIWATVNGTNTPVIGCGLPGERNLSSEKLAEMSFNQVKREIDVCSPIDEYALDQILLPLAIKGDFEIYARQVTKHTKTNMTVIEKFLGPTFDQSIDDKTNLVRIVPKK